MSNRVSTSIIAFDNDTYFTFVFLLSVFRIDFETRIQQRQIEHIETLHRD